MKKLFTTLVVLLFVLSLVGCDAQEEQTTEDTTAAESEAKGETFTQKFTDFVKKKLSAKYYVEYEVDSGEQKMNMKQWVAGPTKIRMDITMPEGEARTYILGDTIYSCNTLEGDWQCIKMSGLEETKQLASDYFKDVEDNPDDYDISYAGTKQVAGVKTFCFETSVTDQGHTADVLQCFSAEGVPLYMKFEVEGMTGEMVAKSYSKNVKDSDFVVPAEAKDMTAEMEKIKKQMEEMGMDMPQ